MQRLFRFAAFTTIILCCLSAAASEIKYKTMLRGYVMGEAGELTDSVKVSVWENDSIRVPIRIASPNYSDSLIASREVKILFDATQDKKYTLRCEKEGFDTGEMDITFRSPKDQIKNFGAIYIKKSPRERAERGRRKVHEGEDGDEGRHYCFRRSGLRTA